MKIKEISEYGIPREFINRFQKEGIEELYPPQETAIKRGLLDGNNIVLSVPTAAGKTFTASLAAIEKILNGSKVVYIVPLVALANEKHQYFKKLFKGEGKVAMSVGDLDSSNPWLAKYDFIVCTTEKLDSLIRHGADWVRKIGLVIVDEVHLLNDMSRGPTLEILLTRLKEIVPDAQFLSLSATINNSDELADWMRSEEIVSDFRPVELFEGVSYVDKIHFLDKDDYELGDGDHENALMENTLNIGKQALFFVSSRRNAEGLAKRLSKTTRERLNRLEKDNLSNLSDDILNVLESPTRQCKKLAKYVKSGSAFHHAGLLRKQKELVEKGFREGLIKCISATPTLAMGVNLPAFRVVLRDSKRYYRGIGSSYIPVLEYKQFAGRAGRPQYDDFGESIIVAKSEGQVDRLIDRYILGEPEEIKSKLAVEPVLRMHTLSLISSGFTSTEEDLLDFFSKTFYAYQYGDMSLIEEKIIKILDQLKGWKFVFEKSKKLYPTRMGRRVSELYLDPLTAYNFIKHMKPLKSKNRKIEPFSILQLICNTREMSPLLSLRTGDFSELNEIIAKREHIFLQDIPNEWELGYERFMRSVKTAIFFESWMDEVSDDKILREFRVAPGELRGRLHNADWLLYSLHELALLLGMKDFLKDIKKTRVRMRYGAKEELLPLVRLKSIGRVRARKLFKSNLKTIADLREIPIESLSRIIGPKIAYNIKEQLGEDVDKPTSAVKSKQINLENF